MKSKSFLPLLAVAVTMIPALFSHSCANTTESPTGGVKDTIPPSIVDIKPFPGTVNFPLSGQKIYITFDEYVTVKNAKGIFLSPPLDKKLRTKISGKTLILDFNEQSLQPNTTYTLSLGDAIADNNEGNIFPGFSFVFSTGSQIDSMFITGCVVSCTTLNPVKDATVMLYKDHSDSAVFLRKPYAAAKTDQWGFFSIPFIQDTLYRLYAMTDASDNNVYDPSTDKIAFCDTIIRPVQVVNDTIYELMKFDMKDTLECLARKTEHVLKLFKERSSIQALNNTKRTSDRSAYITFNAPNVWIDSLWVGGYKPENIITQFNIERDSLELWLNGGRTPGDTMHLFVAYRRSDSLGKLKPSLEHLKLTTEGTKKRFNRFSRKEIKHEDTICVYTLTATPELFESEGYSLEFKYPIIYQNYDSVRLKVINPRQKESFAKYTIEKDPDNLRKFRIRPSVKIQKGYEYVLKVPKRTFKDIYGYYCDSLEVKTKLPSDEELSILTLDMQGVDRKIIVELLSGVGQSVKVERKYIISSNSKLIFPYLKRGQYVLRITDDGNQNNIVDTGCLLEHRQPEKVVIYKFNGVKYIDIPKSSEIEQTINVKEVL